MKCNNDWYICRNCTFQRTPLSNIKNVKRHYFAFHVKKNKELKSNDNMSETVIDITSERAENSHYFSKHHDLNGPAYLVGRSQYQLSSICSYLSQEDVLLQMKFANFFRDLPQNKVEEMVDIISNLTKKSMTKKGHWECNIPKQKSDVRSLYKEGKHCVYRNLPYPKITEVSNHSYVSVIEIISDALAHDLSVVADNNEKENESLQISFMRWSDDFEPYNGNKANRGNGIWVSTLTLILPSYKKECVHNTYLLAVGAKGDDHNLVEDRFQRDLKSINDHGVMFHSKKINKKTEVSLVMIAYLEDSPERHTLCSLTRGNGNYTLRWGYTFDKKSLINYLPSCDKCLSKLESNVSISDNYCKKFLNWDVSNTEHNLTYYQSPEDYPKDFNDLKDGKLNSKKITFTTLKEICGLAHKKIAQGRWSSKQAISYMMVHGINEILRDKIINHADNLYMKRAENEILENKNEID